MGGEQAAPTFLGNQLARLLVSHDVEVGKWKGVGTFPVLGFRRWLPWWRAWHQGAFALFTVPAASVNVYAF